MLKLIQFKWTGNRYAPTAVQANYFNDTDIRTLNEFSICFVSGNHSVLSPIDSCARDKNRNRSRNGCLPNHFQSQEIVIIQTWSVNNRILLRIGNQSLPVLWMPQQNAHSIGSSQYIRLGKQTDLSKCKSWLTNCSKERTDFADMKIRIPIR